MCVCACVRACVCACVRACLQRVYASVHLYVYYVCMYVLLQNATMNTVTVDGAYIRLCSVHICILLQQVLSISFQKEYGR